MAQKIHLVTTIVAIMAILKKKKKKHIWILLEHNCCNYGNSEKKRIQLTPDNTIIVAIVAIVAILTKDTVDSWWQQLLQLWKKQIWIPVTTIVAIMAILNNPCDINCRNYGNFEEKKIYGSLFIITVVIMAILEKIQLTPDNSNCCNVAIVEKTNMNPDDNNCRNYGNSENC